MKNNIPVVLLCGGKGTRLQELTEVIPKPLVEVGGKPILWHIMKIYSSFGFNNFIICLGHKGHKIKEYFLDYEYMNNDITITLGKDREKVLVHNRHDESDWKITLVNTGEDVMTGSRIKRIQRYIEGDHFLLTYGDGVADIDIHKLLEFHLSHGKIGTVSGVRPSSRFGQLEWDGDQITAFKEKPQTKTGRINGGFFVFNKGIFKYVSEDENCVFEGEPLENLAADQQLMMFQHDGFWQCVDTPRDKSHLDTIIASQGLPWLQRLQEV